MKFWRDRRPCAACGTIAFGSHTGADGLLHRNCHGRLADGSHCGVTWSELEDEKHFARFVEVPAIVAKV